MQFQVFKKVLVTIAFGALTLAPLSAQTKLSWLIDGGNAANNRFSLVKGAMEKATGFQIDFNIVPGEGEQVFNKIQLNLIAGDTSDMLPIDNPLIGHKFANGKLLLPLNDLAKKAGVDLDKTYGSFLTKYKNGLPTRDKDGVVYFLPAEQSVNVVFYNKKIFDDAGVPYPTGSWTWSQFIATAKKLTNAKKGIYGALNNDYENYFIFQALQKGVPGYKADGSSNFDDPEFAKALKFYADLGNVHKIQPSWGEMTTKKIAWDAFMNGNYGMWVIGSWALGLMDPASYPRDWKWGVTQAPTPDDGKGNNAIGISSSYALGKNTKQPEAAFRAVKSLTDVWATTMHSLPSRNDLTSAQLDTVLSTIASAKDGVTVQDLKLAFYDSKLGMNPEKLVGPAAAEIASILSEEAGLYCIGSQSLDVTMKNLKQKSDKAIKKAISNQ